MEYNIGIIILAAGSSSRLGQPKQLLDFNGNKFIQNCVQEVFAFSGNSSIVVTGANRKAVVECLNKTKVSICHNPHWELGMGSSIKTGLKKLLLVNPEIECCIVSVCDQPYVTTEVFSQLYNQQQTSGKGIVASAYSGTIGVPVLFTKTYFDALFLLEDQEGAKKLLSKFNDDVTSISFENGAIDIDTLADYNKLIL